MNTKMMEGLAGANRNMNLLHTPFRVYKEARRKGDMATMERAMGYVSEFADKADEYQAEADEGMKEDAKTAREKEKAEREKVIQKRKEEREKLKERIEESKEGNKESGVVEVSEEGRILLKKNAAADGNDSEHMELDSTAFTNIKIDKEPVLYTKTGSISQPERAAGISISV